MSFENPNATPEEPRKEMTPEEIEKAKADATELLNRLGQKYQGYVGKEDGMNVVDLSLAAEELEKRSGLPAIEGEDQPLPETFSKRQKPEDEIAA